MILFASPQLEGSLGLGGNSREPTTEELLEDKIFRALSDMTRRRLLVLISNEPGINVSALCEEFPVSRFAVMKHLNILEAAGLIRREKKGNHRVFWIERKLLDRAVDAFFEDLK